VSSGQITQSGTLNNDSNQNAETDNVSRVSGTRINTEQPETSFWSELQTSIQAILGGAEGRSVVVNPQSGIVVVRAMPQELREVETFLEATEAIARRQVILEAKILEVELSEGYRQGINWGALVNVDGHPLSFGQTGGGTILGSDPTTFGAAASPSDLNSTTQAIGDLNPDNNALGTISAIAASAFGGMFAATLALGDFNAFIELLETQGNVHVLSSPRISTMNNQKAVIKVGSDEFFITEITSDTTTTTTGGTIVSPSVELTPFFSGIALDVTPQISPDSEVMLHVHPAVSIVTDDPKEIPIGTGVQTLSLALSTVRESDSIIRARSGQVVVIGGLMEDRMGNDEARTPVLGDAPGIGSLFRNTRSASRKTELVILLRPVVVGGGERWAQYMQDTANRIRAMNNVVRERARSSDLGGALQKEAKE
jgi:MSHA biogenesis protein MshL